MDVVIRTLRGRVALAAAVAAAVVLIGVAGIVLAGARRDERAALDGRLTQRAQVLAAGSATRLPAAAASTAITAAGAAGGEGESIRLVRRGTVLAGSTLRNEGFPVPRRAGLRTFRLGGERWRASAVRVRGAPGTLVEVASPLSEVDATVTRVRRRILVVGLLGLCVAIALASLGARLAVRSLARLRRQADEITGTDHLGRRVAEDGPEEVTAVAQAMNAMLERLEQSTADRERALAATRRFAADAGHELRGPLAVMQTSLETLVRHPEMSARDRRLALADTLAEHERLVTLVGGLQALTRGDGGAMGDETEIDLSVVAGAAVRAAGVRHPQADLTLNVSPRMRPVHASPTGLRLLVDNLIANAVQHGGRGGPVRIRVTALPHGQQGASVVVEDDGPGIPESDRARVTERFVRGSGAAGEGSGLGLAIAAQQVERSRGVLRIDDSPLGGARVTATLRSPAASDPPADEPAAERGPEAAA